MIEPVTGPAARPAHWRCDNCISFNVMGSCGVTVCCLTPHPLTKDPADFCIESFRTTWPDTAERSGISGKLPPPPSDDPDNAALMKAEHADRAATPPSEPCFTCGGTKRIANHRDGCDLEGKNIIHYDPPCTGECTFGPCPACPSPVEPCTNCGRKVAGTGNGIDCPACGGTQCQGATPPADPDQPCPHPARAGRHEWYTDDLPKGGWICRACGAMKVDATDYVAEEGS